MSLNKLAEKIFSIPTPVTIKVKKEPTISVTEQVDLIHYWAAQANEYEDYEEAILRSIKERSHIINDSREGELVDKLIEILKFAYYNKIDLDSLIYIKLKQHEANQKLDKKDN